MSVFKFIKKPNGVNVQRDGISIHNWAEAFDDMYPAADTSSFTIVMAGIGHVFLMTNTIIANASGTDVDITATGASAICDTLRDTIFVNNILTA